MTFLICFTQNLHQISTLFDHCLISNSINFLVVLELKTKFEDPK